MASDLEFNWQRIVSLGFVLPSSAPVSEDDYPTDLLTTDIHARTYPLGIHLKLEDVEKTMEILRSGQLWVIDNRGGGKSYEEITGEEPPQDHFGGE
jgi:hypothetical protein